MKILHTTNFFKPSWESGGSARVAYGFSKKLTEKGHEVTVYTTDGFKSKLNVEKNKPVDVDGIRTYYFRNLSHYLTKEIFLPIPYYSPVIARREIKDFDIIHIHDYRNMLGAIVYHYAKKYRIPYVLQAHGNLPRIQGKQYLKWLYDTTWGNRLINDAEKIIFTSKLELKESQREFPIPKNKIEFIPNGIDLSKTSLPKKGNFRKKYSIKNDDKIVLYLGRIHSGKGTDLLVNSFSRVNEILGDITLVFVGSDTGYSSSVMNLVDNLGISDKVIFTGPLYEEEKLQAYMDANVFVLPSCYESFGIVALEACACSTPIIVTNNCGISEWIANKAGCVIDYDEEQLKKAIIKVLSDEKLRERFKEEGSKLVRTEFSLDNIVRKLEKLYETILLKNYN